MKTCDLHTHSTFSDGTLTPEELVDLAIEIGLDAIALTDHNTVGGLVRFSEHAEKRGLKAINGIELSVDFCGKEVHLVGLFIKPEHFPKIKELLAEANKRKDASNRELVALLYNAGYRIDYEEILSALPDVKRANRAHIAAELVRKGYVADFDEAFRTLLHESCGFYKPPGNPDAMEMIRFLRSIDAVPVLAHAFEKLTVDETRAFAREGKENGLIAIETLYPSFTAEQTALAKEIAAENGLLESGGSDFHGQNRPTTFLGVGKNNISVPLEFAIKLEKAR